MKPNIIRGPELDPRTKKGHWQKEWRDLNEGCGLANAIANCI